jgi:predicted dehydrogenase
MTTTRVGVVGCGVISRVYQKVAREFSCLEVVACSDIDPAAAKAFAEADPTGVTRALGFEELLEDPGIDLVVNLTIPIAHARVTRAALHAGKAVYSEKPLATSRDDGSELVRLALENGQLLGCAPDTFLGAGLQTCRRALDEGLIGEPVAAVAFFGRHGPEEWHPNPAFFYEPGAGPLFDLGPYYLTTTVALLGPIVSVSGVARISAAERPIRAGNRAGEVLRVSTPTHVTGTLELASGVPVTFITSFDVWADHLPRFEIYGTEGTLSVPDPNTFGGPVELWEAATRQWRTLRLVNSYTENSRGLGLAELASARSTGRAPRASSALAFHVLDAMAALLEAGEERTVVRLSSDVDRPVPLPEGLARGEID